MRASTSEKRPFLGDKLRHDLNEKAQRALEKKDSRIRIALAGNPNCGKTSLFNRITGSHQHVGNWSGVTVEVKEGTTSIDKRALSITDLPGTYSLSTYSMEEKVARDFLIDGNSDVVINVVDATNLERNLYLTIQLLEAGIRPILAFNMWDEVQAKGIQIDISLLSKLLDITIIPTIGKTGHNLDLLLRTAIKHHSNSSVPYSRPLAHLPDELETGITKLLSHPALSSFPKQHHRWIILKLFEHDSSIRDSLDSVNEGKDLLYKIKSQERIIEQVYATDTESLIAEARYGFISGAIRETVKKQALNRIAITDAIDKVLTHPVWAFPIFIFFMWLLFQVTFTIGGYPMTWIESLVSLASDIVSSQMPPGVLQDLIVQGIINGVGGVIIFLPNILILFFGIAIMEDTGYMARAAFIMDKVMHKVGLHGKSFIPMLMGMGCNVPAIMATRTLESPIDRTKTILLAPLISCSARLPVYVLFAGALFGKHAGNIVFLFQFVLGTTAFFAMAFLFKKTILRNDGFPFVMELPPYRMPTFRSVSIHMWQKAVHYLQKMGGVVLIFSIIIWALGAFPKNKAIESQFEQTNKNISASSMSAVDKQSAIDKAKGEHDNLQMQQSYISRIGRFLEPAVQPLGFDWRGAVALVTGFVAKEVVVSSMGILYAEGRGTGAEHNEILRAEIAKNYTPLTGFCFMLFVLLYTPCIVALVTIVRELKSVKWSIFSVVYQLFLAWFAAFSVYQVGRMIGLQ